MRRGLDAFRRRYGAGPLHLLAALATFAVVGLGVRGWFDEPAVSLRYILIWFAGAIIAHDLILLPLYSALDRVGAGRSSPSADPAPAAPARSPWWVYVRVPLLLSGLLLLVFGPEIFEQGDATYHLASGQHQGVYLGRYLVIVAVLFTLSGLAFALRGRSAHARTPARRGHGG